jgi:type II secretory pathway pseudopilin PulG
VVIALIAVLTGILLPAFSGVLYRARTTQCLSNVRQITACMIAYANDHNGQLPPDTYEVQRMSTLVSENYVRDQQILICPVNKEAGSHGLTNPTQGACYTSYYSANYAVRTAWYSQNGPSVASPSSLTAPQAFDIPVVWDQRADENTGMNLHQPNANQPGGVFGYLDGSVEYLVKPQSVLRNQ